jgi:hypothetical protein
MNVFTDIKVQPAYGFEQSLVNWTLLPAYADGEVYLYRSPDGVEVSDAWVLLNEDNPVINQNFYIDNGLTDKNLQRQYFYRLTLFKDGEYYDSPVIGMYSEGLNKTEYGVLRYMRKNEYLRMRSRNGVRILHCIPTIEGELNNDVDDILQAKLGAACKEGDKDSPDMYQGRGIFEKEFSTIFQTWAELSSIGPVSVEYSENSTNNKLTQAYQLRLLGFPKPEVGHMIVLPNTDTRLLVTNNITPYYFKGYLPVAYDVAAEELPKDDSRYSIPLPVLNLDPDKAITVNTAL